MNNIYFVKSKNKCKYIYLQHSPVSLVMAYNSEAFNHFDSIQAINTFQYNEIKLLNEKFNKKIKPFKSRYSFLDLEKKKSISEEILLIAPTWNTDFYEKNFHINLFELLKKNNIKFEFRPHYMSILKNEINLALIKNIDLNLDNKLNLKKYSHLITDWSGIYLEYLIVNKKKPILIETKKKVNNKDYLNYFRDYITIEEKYRKTLGNIVYKENLSECLKYINHKEQNDLNLINKFIDEVFF